MKLTCYRLLQYKIVKNDLGDMWWELHTAFGDIKRGKCFIIGDILILGEGNFEEPGFLMLEYHEQLSRLPIWRETEYYCLNPTIYSCRTNNKVGLSTLKSIKPLRRSDLNEKDIFATSKDISFRLSKYEIIEMCDGKKMWITFEGYKGIKSGKCFIKQDILFMEPGILEDKEVLKKDFLKNLKQLPVWHKTHYFCPKAVPYPCVTKTFTLKKYHMNVSNKAPTLKSLRQIKPKEHNLMKTSDNEQRQTIKTALTWITFIKTFTFSLMEFIYNLLIELIGIKKK